jgi:hypothetical protein
MMRVSFRLGGLAFFLVSACTIVNAFDDVTPSAEGTYGPAASAGNDAAVFVANDAGGGIGAVVLAGEESRDGAAGNVLVTLDPTTGHQLGARETMTVAGIRYDGLRDHWYVFESKGSSFIPGPNDRVVLRTRALDVRTGAWTDLGAIDVPATQSYDSIAIVRDRLVYVALKPTDTTPTLSLVTINTADPTKLSIVDDQPMPAGRHPRGIVGTRSRTNVGGIVSMFRTAPGGENCPDGGNCYEVFRVRVGQGAPIIEAPLALATVSGFATSTAFGSFPSIDREVIVFPRVQADASATVQLYEPVNHEVEPATYEFTLTDGLIRPIAVSECDRQVFAVGGNSDLDLHAIPIPVAGKGTPFAITTGHSGQAVYFEPSTKTVLAPFGQGTSTDLGAYRVGGTKEAPTLARREADWQPPNDIRPIFLATKQPIPAVCP